MTDPNADDGASPKELLFASCRQHNVDLLRETFSALPSPEKVGDLINKSRDPLGNTALHIAAIRGSLECLDLLLDQEGVEVDPRNRMEGDTPLHSAARLSIEDGAEDEAKEVIEMLLEAGADPRIRNKGSLKAVDIVSPQHTELKTMLKRAELKYIMGADVVDDDDSDEGDSASDED